MISDWGAGLQTARLVRWLDRECVLLSHGALGACSPAAYGVEAATIDASIPVICTTREGAGVAGLSWFHG